MGLAIYRLCIFLLAVSVSTSNREMSSLNWLSSSRSSDSLELKLSI